MWCGRVCCTTATTPLIKLLRVCVAVLIDHERMHRLAVVIRPPTNFT